MILRCFGEGFGTGLWLKTPSGAAKPFMAMTLLAVRRLSVLRLSWSGEGAASPFRTRRFAVIGSNL